MALPGKLAVGMSCNRLERQKGWMCDGSVNNVKREEIRTVASVTEWLVDRIGV